MAFTSAATFVVLGIVVTAYLVYRHPSRAYAIGKSERIATIPGMSILYRPIKIITLVVCLLSLHCPNRWLLIVPRPVWIGWTGIVVSTGGAALLVWSKASLGSGYSPCFDSWVPHQLVNAGPYRRIRHPMYTGNFLMLGGLTLVSASCWQLLCFSVVLVYFVASAYSEERSLKRHLPQYAKYVEKTGAFVPRISRTSIISAK